MPEFDEFDLFLRASRIFCGFDQFDLNATDCAEEYFDTLKRQIGEDNMTSFLNQFSDDNLTDTALKAILDDERNGPIARNLICMWYLGNWNALPNTWIAKFGKKILSENNSFVISAGAYKEGLVWKAMGAHPMGAKPGGFGSWALAPDDRGSKS